MFLDADGETPDTGIAQRPVKTLIECREQLKSKQRLNAGQNHSRLFQSLLDFRLERLSLSSSSAIENRWPINPSCVGRGSDGAPSVPDTIGVCRAHLPRDALLLFGQDAFDRCTDTPSAGYTARAAKAAPARTESVFL
jgi:hypothetical protein